MAALLLHYKLKALACIVQLLLACLLIRNAHVAAAAQHNTSCSPSDRQALSSFAAGVHASVLILFDHGGVVAMNESWNRERDCCSWRGVSCTSGSTASDSQNNTSSHLSAARRVTALSLSFHEFRVSSATILESLCNLPFLSTLSISNEPTSHEIGHDHLLQIPECLGEQLPLLKALYLSYLNLKGPIPSSFSRLIYLQSLDLSINPALSGPLLPLLHLPSLTSLSLSACSFSGPLPSFNTPLLQSLDLSGNSFNSTLHRFTRLSNLTALTYLDLSNNFISGPIPSSISRLFSLQDLSLTENSLSGTLLDSELCKLIDLTSLDLTSNKFTGPFPPCIGHLSSLNTLSLSFNQFASPIPDEWHNLQNLESIELGSGSSLNGTRLPDWLFRFPQLTSLSLISLGLQSEDVLCNTRVSMLNQTLGFLDLSGNNITGSDLLECFALHNFQQALFVVVSENPLSISLSHIQLAPAIHNLILSNCSLTGFLNDKTFEGRGIALNLSHNHLVGKIPRNLTVMWRQLIDLSDNLLTGFDSYGSFQSSLSSSSLILLSNNLIAGDVSTVLQILGFRNCTKGINSYDITLDLSNNRLVGEIPTSLAECASSNLDVLFLDHNNLTGHIPENFGKFKNMYAIRLNNNQLKGTIPTSIITLNNLELLEVSYNDLEGDLKALFSFMQSPSSLVVLGLAHNRISGSIPRFLGNFTPALRVIDLSYNNLTGTIPRGLYLPSFQVVEIFTLSFDGFKALPDSIPSLVIKGVERTLEDVWKNFRFLDLSVNYLEGFIPSELGDLSALLQLNLSHNSLSGPIPEAFGKLSLLETLDLSFNKLRGSIPRSLLNLTKLEVFNVSYNEGLVGSIPLGSQLENNDSYIGDKQLCGYPVLQACQVVNVTYASNNNTVMSDKAATWNMDEWVAIPGLCLGIVVGFFGVLWLLHGPPLPRLP